MNHIYTPVSDYLKEVGTIEPDRRMYNVQGLFWGLYCEFKETSNLYVKEPAIPLRHVDRVLSVYMKYNKKQFALLNEILQQLKIKQP